MTTKPKCEQTLSGFVCLEQMPEMAVEILRAAMELFSRKGYAATSVREIVQEARVTNPMLYYYFGNKEGVFRQLIDIMFGELNARLSEVLALDIPFEERIRQIVHVHMDALASSPDSVQFVYTVLFGPPESCPFIDIMTMQDPIDAELERMFAKAMKDGILTPHAHVGLDPEHLCFSLWALVNQHMMYTLKSMQAFNKDGAAQAHLDALTGPEAVRRLVGLFLCGAGHVKKEQG